MSDVVELARRAERLQDQADMLRQEIDQLRRELLQLGAAAAPSQTAPTKPGCLLTALALAQDLGAEFTSEQPHDLAGRGADWFAE